MPSACSVLDDVISEIVHFRMRLRGREITEYNKEEFLKRVRQLDEALKKLGYVYSSYFAEDSYHLEEEIKEGNVAGALEILDEMLDTANSLVCSRDAFIISSIRLPLAVNTSPIRTEKPHPGEIRVKAVSTKIDVVNSYGKVGELSYLIIPCEIEGRVKIGSDVDYFKMLDRGIKRLKESGIDLNFKTDYTHPYTNELTFTCGFEPNYASAYLPSSECVKVFTFFRLLLSKYINWLEEHEKDIEYLVTKNDVEKLLAGS